MSARYLANLDAPILTNNAASTPAIHLPTIATQTTIGREDASNSLVKPALRLSARYLAATTLNWAGAEIPNAGAAHPNAVFASGILAASPNLSFPVRLSSYYIA
jgi:hypothetical protein